MVAEKTGQEFRLKNIDETRSYFVEEIDQNELMSNKHKIYCRTVNFVEHFLILTSAVIEYISAISAISAFASLIGIPIGTTSSVIGLKIYTILQDLIMSIIKEKKRKHDKMVSSAKSKLNSIEALFFRVLKDLNSSPNEFLLTVHQRF